MELYEYETMRTVEDTYWWFRGLRTLVCHRVQELVQNMERPQILDAGCGTGGMMQELKLILPRAELTGIDFEPAAVQFSKERHVGAVFQASVESLPFPDQTFDVILSLDVICSRGIDDLKALEESYRTLKPGGSLLLNLQAFDLLKGQHDLAGHAERRYTKQRVSDLLTAAHFKVEMLTYWNMTLFPILMLWRPLSLLLADKQKPRSDLKLLPEFINQTLTWLILQEIQATKFTSLPFGSSVFAIARK